MIRETTRWRPVASPGTTGNDIIIPGDGDDTLFGDPFDGQPAEHGAAATTVLTATGDDNTLFGDAYAMSGDARGGNDRLSATGDNNSLFGDANDMSGDARGGNDRLSATGEFGINDASCGNAATPELAMSSMTTPAAATTA